jgi:signal transduction histidine kinase
MGGVLLLSGVLVNTIISVLLIDRIDTMLIEESSGLVEVLRLNAAGQFDLRSYTAYQPSGSIYYQVWGNDGQLKLARPLDLVYPLDENGLQAEEPFFNTYYLENVKYRVLSLPLATELGPVGVLQIAVNLSIVDLTQQILLRVVSIITILSMLVASVLSWMITGRALSPLAVVTKVATKITNADDLQRRIPTQNLSNDEVGLLINAFNATLERLEQLFNIQRRFTADVSHELRTPLTVIKGNVGLMRRIKEFDEESLNSIENEVDRLTRLVGDLLLLSQADSGQLPLKTDLVSMDTIFLEVFQQMLILAGDRLTLNLNEIDQILVIGDPDRLKQVLVNLIGNAINYTPNGGAVNLSLTKADGLCLLEIQDNGPGIPEEDLPHIFERFYRGEKSRTRHERSGFGLGLPIANWIIRNHGGKIEYHSVIGQGTTFTVILPLATAYQGYLPEDDD